MWHHILATIVSFIWHDVQGIRIQDWEILYQHCKRTISQVSWYWYIIKNSTESDWSSLVSLSLSEKDCSNSTDSLCRGKGHGHWSHQTPLLLSRPRIWTGINLSDWSNVEEPCYVKTSLDTWHPSLTQGQMAKDALPPKFIIKWQSITHSHIVDLIMMQY